MPKTTKTFREPQACESGPAPDIALNPVDSNKIAAIGYDPETQTLAVTFQRAPFVYHYPNVDAATSAAFMAAESKGRHFIDHLQALPFKKYRLEQASA